jgi:hypothetical protein
MLQRVGCGRRTRGNGDSVCVETIGELKRFFGGEFVPRVDYHRGFDSAAAHFVAAERQSLRDLRQRYANIRIAINRVNMETSVELLGTTRTIAEWIVWKREIHTMHAEELNAIANSIKTVRTKAASLGKQISSDKDSTGPQDVIVNLDEAAVLKEAEELAATLSTLDGKLSLVNATVRITV